MIPEFDAQSNINLTGLQSVGVPLSAIDPTYDGNGLGDINDLFVMFGNWGICP